MKKNKLVVLVIFIIVMVLALIIFGQFVGGLLLAKLLKAPYSMVEIDTLINYAKTFGHIKSAQPIIFGSVALSILIPVLPVVVICIAVFVKPKRSLHGDAKFADMNDIRKAGLIDNKNTRETKYPSLIVGKYKGHFLEYYGQQFMFLSAPTRSGKGVGIVIPNLLHYSHSVVVLDIKLENWVMTAGFRTKQLGHECFLFAPDSEKFKSHRWNPLSYIRRNPAFVVGDILNIASVLYPAQGKDAFWENSAQTLFLALVLYMIETPEEPCNLSHLLELATPDGGLKNWIPETVYKRKMAGNPLSKNCVNAFNDFADASDNTASNILNTLKAPLNVFRDAVTAAATSGDDFNLKEVRRKKMSIYVGISPKNLAKFDKLLNLFFSQLITENTDVLPEEDPSLKYQCTLIMDEFTAPGRISIIEKSVAFTAGYNMRYLLIFQSQSQLEPDHLYGKEGTRTLLVNMALQVIYAPRDDGDAKLYSELLGYTTQKSISKSKQISGKSSRGENESDQRRALLLPQEIKEIGKDKEIISIENIRPILADKIRWYSDEILKTRANWDAPEVPSLTIKEMKPLNSQPLNSERARG